MAQSNVPWPTGVGEMAERVRRFDWGATSLGPSAAWSDRLKLAVEMVLASPLVASLACGPQRLLIYNDAAARLYSDRHPIALGCPLPDTFPEGYAAIAPYYERALAGETVLVTGQPLDTRGEGTATDVFDALLIPVREADGRVEYVHMIGSEIGGRLRVENALRGSEERQAFLLRLSDALRAELNTGAIADLGLRMLSEHLQLDRCYIGLYRVAEDRADLPHQVGNGRVPPLPDSIRLSDFPNALQVAVEGTLVIDDFQATAGLSDTDRRNIGGLGLRALVAATLRKGEHNPLWTTVAVSSQPRRWTRVEISVVEEAAERIWAAMERSRVETALRHSDARFQQFADASATALWIRDAKGLGLEYASPAMEAIYGVPPDALLGDPRHWASLIVPEDRLAALAHLEQVQGGKPLTHEFRILRASDDAFRWIRSTDFPLLDEQGRVQRVGGIAEDVTEAKQAADHQAVLLLELQHRVRNTLAVVQSITTRTGDTATDVDDYRERLEGRLRALARVQTLLTRAANVGVDLPTLIRAEVTAQAAHKNQLTLNGAELLLSPKAAEVLTLAVHELATNALKYGALSHVGGGIVVSWRVAYDADEPWLRLDWIETGAPAPLQQPKRRGFGTALIEQRIPYELQGRSKLTFEPEGARCRLEFPLRRGDSILETDTVTLSTTIAGGSLDMAGEANLDGCKVLVVEDDYYIATDEARALTRAGGTVLGPFGQEGQALAQIAHEVPRCAVVDINLGQGPRFEVADALQERGVPFVFVTGYDDVVIPARFDGVERLRKPIEFRQLVRAVAQLCGV